MTWSRSARAAGVAAGTCIVLTGGAGQALAASRHAGYVSGRVNLRGYTLAVVGYNGKASVTGKTSFRLRAPDTKVTLQLVGPDGRYAGPVVLGGGGSKVVVGVKAGTNVGTIVVVPAKGYAHLSRRLSARHLDRSRWAFARRGVPLGNGHNFGLIVSKIRGTGAGTGRDPAHIGIPNEFNIAVPGTKALKALARAAKTKARSTAACGPAAAPVPVGCAAQVADASLPGWMNSLGLPIDRSVNADAANVTPSEIDSALQGDLTLGLLNVDASADRVELNCTQLSYCSDGGTGEAELGASTSATPPRIPFPAGSLDPVTRLGELVGPEVPTGLLAPGPNQLDGFTLIPHATSAQVGSGDVVFEEINKGATSTEEPVSLGFVFVTTPALASYSDTAGDTAGHSGTIAYPDAGSTAVGTAAAPIKVAPGPNGDTVLRLTFFRPQRLGVAGAGEAQFMDIGNLNYAIDVMAGGGPRPGRSGQCPVAAYSAPSKGLSVTAGVGIHAAEGTIVDSTADQPASPANTMSVTVDLNQCAGGALPTDRPTQINLAATTSSLPTDSTRQTFWVQGTG